MLITCGDRFAEGLLPMPDATVTMHLDKGLDNTVIGESTKSFIDGQQGVLEYVGIDIVPDLIARHERTFVREIAAGTVRVLPHDVVAAPPPNVGPTAAVVVAAAKSPPPLPPSVSAGCAGCSSFCSSCYWW